jgi:hypothetical protein
MCCSDLAHPLSLLAIANNLVFKSELKGAARIWHSNHICEVFESLQMPPLIKFITANEVNSGSSSSGASALSTKVAMGADTRPLFLIICNNI